MTDLDERDALTKKGLKPIRSDNRILVKPEEITQEMASATRRAR